MARPKHSIEDIVSKNYRFISDYFERGIQHQGYLNFIQMVGMMRKKLLIRYC